MNFRHGNAKCGDKRQAHGSQAVFYGTGILKIFKV